LSTYWTERLETVKSLISALDQALLEFAQDGGKQTVSMDTGQSRVSYSRSDISSMKSTRSALLNELATLEVRTGACSGSFYGRTV
jgi:hypothetical protein